MNDDPVLTELDAEVKRLEVASRKLDAELQKVREMRDWWAGRHPVVTQLGQAVETEHALPIQVVKGVPTLKELTVKVLEIRPEPLAVPQIRDGALELGWQTDSPNKGTMVRNTLMQLIDDGVVERVNDNRYRLSRPHRARATWQVNTPPENGEQPEVDATPTPPGPGG